MITSMDRSVRLAVLLGLFLGALSLLGALATPATAQDPAVCQQYNPPNCEGSVGPAGAEGSSTDDGTGDLVAFLDLDEAGTGGASGETSGELPFTGYPLTSLILLLLVLLALGLAVRAYLAARDRLRARSASPPSFG
jgi:hypothetical protein